MNVRSIRLAAVALAALLPVLAPAAETRIALVIGNSAYSSGSLPNPVNDAKLIAEGLKGVGFEVIARHNADQIAMKRAIQEFGERLEKAGPDSVGLFYYAGHGVQLNGRNYLIPTTASIEREGDVEIEAVSADWVLEQMRYARNRLNIVILDACRNNPFTRSMRGVVHGLASMDAPAGILIAYSTAPGEVAQDGGGHNSPYTEALKRAMLAPEPVEEVFKHVRVSVMGATDGKQVPWEVSSLTGDFYFAPRSASSTLATAAAPTAAPAPAATAAPARSSEPASGGLMSWVSSWFESNSTPPPSAMAARPPPNPAASSSGTKLAMNGPPPNSPPANTAAALAPAGPVVAGARVLPVLNSLGISTDGVDASHDYREATVRQLIEETPRRVTLGSTAEQLRSAYSLCRQYGANCSFDDEALRRVTLRPFELDAHPVSVREFREFTQRTHYETLAEKQGHSYEIVDGKVQEVTGGSWRNGVKRHPVEDDAPVVGVSYQDALAYCHYKNARLPTENEWEYVARGPQRNVFPWGNDVETSSRSLGIAPHVTDGSPQGIGGRYKGLAGGVWQWVDTKVAEDRVLKGASWLEPNPANQRAAVRSYGRPELSYDDAGIRCARTATTWPDADIWLSQLR